MEERRKWDETERLFKWKRYESEMGRRGWLNGRKTEVG